VLGGSARIAAVSLQPAAEIAAMHVDGGAVDADGGTPRSPVTLTAGSALTVSLAQLAQPGLRR
jgi:hypothetical protein